MSLFDERFDRWQASDFEAYAPAKQRSNRFNLQRSRVRQRLVSLLEQALDAAEGPWPPRAELGAHGLQIWSSLDHPHILNDKVVCLQTAGLCRDAQTRERLERLVPAVSASLPRRDHVLMGVEVDVDGLRWVLRLGPGASVDRAVAQADATLSVALDEVAGEVGGAVTRTVDGAWRLEVLVGAEDATRDESPVERGRAFLAACWPLFRRAQWRDDLDPGGLVQREAAAAQTQRADGGHSDGKQRPAAAAVPPPRTTGPFRPADAARPHAGVAPAGSATPAPKPPPPRPARPVRPERPGRSAGPGRSQGPRHPGPKRGRAAGEPWQTRSEPKKVEGVAAGARVALRSGLFAGKEGEVVSVKRGKARVRVGAMELDVDLRDLTAV